jgi:ribosomal protein S18 acetylase RimI-like enzyme
MDASGDIELRPATPRDADAIVALFRASFDLQRLELTTYGCEGVESYVRALIEGAGHGADTLYTVARADETVLGAAELRQLADRLFCNFIAVGPELRSRGVGTSLLGAAIVAARRPGLRTLELDVYDDNERALAWYRSLGFGEGATTEWWVLPVPGADRASPAPIAGWAQAAACQEAFGFSEVSIQGANRAYGIGLLGPRLFRLTDPAGLDDPVLAATLRTLDPSRRLLALVPPGLLSEPVAERRATTIRLWAGIDALARRIEAAAT